MKGRIYGNGTYVGLAEVIERDGLKLAPMGETVSLMHPAYKGILSILPFGKRREIRSTMRSNFLYAYTEIHIFPNNLVFYHDVYSLKDRFLNPTKEELEAMLGSKEEKGVVFSDDGSLRRVEGKHMAGELRKGTLSSHPNIIGQTGSMESAHKLDEIAGAYKENPYLILSGEVDKPITTVSALYSVWGLLDRLLVGGGNRGVNRFGCAFGVQGRTGEASRTET